MLDSGGAVVSEVKINQHISPTKAAQLEFSSLRAGKFKVRRLIPDLHREKRSRQQKQADQKNRYSKLFSLHRSIPS
jgi:hypothetical protein